MKCSQNRESTQAYTGDPACLDASLKHLYINAQSVGNQQEELEVCVPLQGYDLVGITETRWVAHRTGVQKWIGTGFLGMKGWEDEEEEMSFR